MSDTITVKCLQGWRGAVQVPSNATVGALVDSIVEAANLQQPSDVTSLIIKGRRLDPEAVRTKACAEVGVVNNTPIMLVIRSPTERAAAAAQDMQLKRMRAVEMAAAALSERVGLGPMDGGEYELQLTNQDGTEIKLAPTDRKGFSLGALLHAKAKALLTERSAEVVGALTSASIADAAGAEANASPPEPSVIDESDVSMDEPSTVGVCMPDTAPEASGEPPAAIDALTALGRALDDVEELLEQAESAFSLVSPRILALGDNAALCLLDCVWCSLLRRLIRRLLRRQTKLTKPTAPPTDEADESDHRQTKLTKPTARRPVGAAGGAGSRDTGSTADEDGAEMGEAERARAATRLGRAKALLRELHGENLQRLAGRDDAGQHRAIYVRLYLLQGGLAMSGGERADAASLLHKADNLRRELTLGPQDAEKLCALVALGLTEHAARASLLACGKDVERAATHALQRLATERARRTRRRVERDWVQRYGRTPYGSPVDHEALQQLIGCGYEEAVSAEALRRTENALEPALSMLCEPTGLESLQMAAVQRLTNRFTDGSAVAGESSGHDGGGGGGAVPSASVAVSETELDETEPDEAKVLQLLEMGFELAPVRRALADARNNLPNAALALSNGLLSAAPAASSPPPPPPPPPPPLVDRLSAAEHEAIAASDLASAVHTAEQAYQENSMCEEAAVIQFLFGQLAAM